MPKKQSIPALVDQLAAIYDESLDNLRRALAAYVHSREVPDSAVRAAGAFAYPELRIDYAGTIPQPTVTRAFARLAQPGSYASSIARPRLFRDYLIEQLEHLSRDYDVAFRSATRAARSRFLMSLKGAGSKSVTSAPPSCRAAFHPTNSSTSATSWPTAPGPQADRPAALAVRRAAHRFQPRPLEALHGNPARAFPAFRAVHQLRPLRR